MKYERRRLDELTPSPDNPRSITKAAKKALAASIKRFGFVQPVIVNETTGNVVGGHQRLEVLREQGATEVDVVVGEWSEAEERALNVTLNNLAVQGQFVDVASYLSTTEDLGLAAFRELRLDTLIFEDKNEHVDGDRDIRTLEYRLVIMCESEEQQATLFEEFEAKGLEVKVVIV
jgi:hypothetical protein